MIKIIVGNINYQNIWYCLLLILGAFWAWNSVFLFFFLLFGSVCTYLLIGAATIQINNYTELYSKQQRSFRTVCWAPSLLAAPEPWTQKAVVQCSGWEWHWHGTWSRPLHARGVNLMLLYGTDAGLAPVLCQYCSQLPYCTEALNQFQCNPKTNTKKSYDFHSQPWECISFEPASHEFRAETKNQLVFGFIPGIWSMLVQDFSAVLWPIIVSIDEQLLRKPSKSH